MKPKVDKNQTRHEAVGSFGGLEWGFFVPFTTKSTVGTSKKYDGCFTKPAYFFFS